MTASSVSSAATGQSPWQALQDLRNKPQSQAAADSTSPMDAAFSLFSTVMPTDGDADTGTASITNTPLTNPTDPNGAAGQLTPGLQSFLLNSSWGTGSASPDGSTPAATGAGDGSTGSGSTSSTTASNTQPDGTNGPNAQSLDAGMLSAMESYATQFNPAMLQNTAMSISA